MSEWNCPRCRARNIGRACEECGHEHRTGPPDGAPTLPAYREMPVRERPVSSPADPCPEPGCTKTVGDHIREFREHGWRIERRLVPIRIPRE